MKCYKKSKKLEDDFKTYSRLTEEDKSNIIHFYRTEENNTVRQISERFKIKWNVVSRVLDDMHREVMKNSEAKRRSVNL